MFLLKCFTGNFKACLSGMLIDINKEIPSTGTQTSPHPPKAVCTADPLVIVQVWKYVTVGFSLSVPLLEVVECVNSLFRKNCFWRC